MHFLIALLMTAQLTIPHPEPLFDYTQQDVDILADVMWLENGSTGQTEDENRQVLILTGSVIINRVLNRGWGGSTVKDVVYARGQYAYSTRSRIGKVETPKWVRQLAEEIVTYGTNVPDYVVYQSMQPQLGTVWKVIDGEYFATSKGYKNEGQHLEIVTLKEIYESEYVKQAIKFSFDNVLKLSKSVGGVRIE